MILIKPPSLVIQAVITLLAHSIDQKQKLSDVFWRPLPDRKVKEQCCCSYSSRLNLSASHIWSI